jgi:hypothetical protein
LATVYAAELQPSDDELLSAFKDRRSRHGIEIKYGGGPSAVQDRLLALSNAFWDLEHAIPNVSEALARRVLTAIGDLEIGPRNN